MSKLVAKKTSSSELTNEMIKIGRIQYYIIFLMVSGLILFGKEFIIWWAGPEFKDSYYVSLILIIPVCFPLIQNLGLSIMQAMNKYKFKSIITFIMAIFNIIISYFLAIKYGPIGTAIGTALSLIICNIIFINIYYYKVIKLDIIKFWKIIIKMTSYFLIAVVIVYLIRLFLPISGIAGVIVYGVFYVTIYSLIAYFFIMNQYEKNFIKMFLIKLILKKVNKNDSN